MLEYTHDLDRDRAFQGKCLTLLHRIENNLVLTTYAKEKIKQEILLKIDKHATISFELLDAQSPLGIKEWVPDIFNEKLPDLERRMLKITIDVPKKEKLNSHFGLNKHEHPSFSFFLLDHHGSCLQLRF
ncbi:MAG: hypothetical protein LVR00_06475 [Rhabdochlamydiaceae bacterium]